MCYVDDTVAGLLALARSDLTGPVNIGSDEELSVLALARLVREITGSDSPVVFVDRPVDDPRFRRPDITLAAERLGWRPRVLLEEGLRRTVNYFRAQRGLPPVSEWVVPAN